MSVLRPRLWWAMVGVLLSASLALAMPVGQKAPDFSLPATTADKVQLADYLGKKNLVLFFYIGAFTNLWTQEAVAFQQDLPKFEAANAQVLGVSVDFNDANKAWGKQLGLTYPLLSDVRREMSKAYEVLADDAAMKDDPKLIPRYLRSNRAWVIIDKEGVVRYSHVATSRDLVSSEVLLQVLQGLP